MFVAHYRLQRTHEGFRRPSVESGPFPNREMARSRDGLESSSRGNGASPREGWPPGTYRAIVSDLWPGAGSHLVRPPGLEPRNLQIKNLLLYR